MGDGFIPKDGGFEFKKLFTETQTNDFREEVFNSTKPISFDIPKPYIPPKGAFNSTQDEILKELEIANQKNDELRKQNKDLQEAVKSLKPDDKKQFWLGVLSGILVTVIGGFILSKIL